MKLIKLSFLFLTMFLFFTAHTKSQESSQTTTIYYYSTVTSSIIISNVDGSEQRILADYTLPESCFNYDSCNISGPGFSPTLLWFSWTSDNNAAYPSVDTQGYVINAHTGEQFELLNGRGGISQLSWSPVEDALLIGSVDLETGNKTYHIWTANTTRELFNLSEKAIVDWTPNGQLVVYDLIDDSEMMNFTIADISGEALLEREIRNIWDESQSFACEPAWSDNGTQMYINSSDQLSIINYVSSQEQSFDFRDDYLIRVDWNSEHTYALVYSSNTCTPILRDMVTNLWLVSLEDQNLTLLSDSAIPPLASRDNNGWSQTDEHFSYVEATDTERIIVVVALPSFVSQEIHLDSPQNASFRPEQAYWLESEQLAFYGLSTTESQAIHTFDPVADTISVLIEGEFVRGNFAFSSSENLIAFDNIVVCNGVCIFDIDRNEYFSFEFLQNLQSSGSGSVDQLLWHPTEDILFVTGSRIGRNVELNLIDFETMSHRAIDGWFVLSPASFGWVPEREG